MIQVIIELHIAETLEYAYEERSRKLLRQAIDAPGFISGETLLDASDSQHSLMLCNLALRG
jgi:hypothetical protein